MKLAWLTLAFVVPLALSCDGGDDDSFSAPDGPAEGDILPVVMTTQLARGDNRFAFQLLDENSQNIPDADVTLRTAQLEGSEGELGPPQDASYIVLELDSLETVVEHEHADGSIHTHSAPYGAGIYTAPLTFPEAGEWGIEFDVRYRGRDESIPLVVTVLEESDVPGIGDLAPPTENYTAADHELSEITSDASPDPELYAKTVAAALDAGDAFVVAFATPAFCHSRVCAPVLEAVKEVKAELPEAAYIHIEPFENLDDPANLRDSPFVAEWNLPNEPWVFVVNRDGSIAAAFEGPFTVNELEEAVRIALAS
ncbi:MAG TPA: hypothetical protein VFO84_07460 [Dehalococcoidia bacterium]|nr:hypothetical protein [Dehalococcoidia bacterium]